ncbi:unnamed protein product [Allacma fusca]|uniref:Uncharacterized protein n=1 Tax=Allacma fusca TaxID=39272 RepID=A0A8J2L189_9HEXA|nr:unnamed protein product [Allacma fusca]
MPAPQEQFPPTSFTSISQGFQVGYTQKSPNEKTESDITSLTCIHISFLVGYKTLAVLHQDRSRREDFECP